ncbi:Ldh family oxidoreductase [Hymenobacter sp. DH14]|uniref:Ldh family oxidoreductase n=1 Tax=Hymenobacter cyanobacteriorum TaxID=2926463 RepID=A0A9X1VK58_9BACT|nr:Ldh family oxidoreductase [Hymenobacter cyanobacteriorum]MCI1189617.1 Ldh family oxidoreductase [Hymenobacter cyanobacteriorum]
MPTFSYSQLFTFTESVFRSIGCPEEDATLATETLLSADLRGVDSHGVARLVGYVRLWEAGRINATPRVGVTYETPSTAVVDGDGGLGLVVGPKAMRVAIEKAQQVGTGWVSVKNSNHFGIAGYHAMLPLAHDMMGIAMTNASPLVAPTYSLDRLLGTNPIAVAVPAGEQPDFVLDMATTTAANGKLEIAQRKGLPLPEGWAQTADGQPSTDANAVKNGGALLPLGGATGSHKGYGLGAVVDIFSAVLSGANYGPWVPPFVAFLQPSANPVGQGLGHFFGAMRVDAFRPADEFKAHMDNWITTFRNAQAVEGKHVLIPGDPEREIAAHRLLDGIPLLDTVVHDLEGVGAKFGVKL